MHGDQFISSKTIPSKTNRMSVKNGIIARISMMFKMSEKNSMFVCDTQNRRNSSITK